MEEAVLVVLRHPYAAFAKTLLEPQRYPDLRVYPGGPPQPPYDVTAHTLPLLMGVTVALAQDSLRTPLSGPVDPPRATPGYPGFDGPDAPRVGLYRSHAGPIDEGWTRWVFDTWKIPYASIVDSVIRAGRLKEKLDVVVLPISRRSSCSTVSPAARYPILSGRAWQRRRARTSLVRPKRGARSYAHEASRSRRALLLR